KNVLKKKKKTKKKKKNKLIHIHKYKHVYLVCTCAKGDGIFNTDGKIWKKHRAIASRIFTMRSLKDHMFECFLNTSDDFMAKLSELTGEAKSSDEKDLQSINISDMFARLTLEAFTFIAFGVNVECIKKAPEILEFPKSFDAAFVICTRRWLDPLYKVKRALNIAEERELNHHVSVVNKFVDDIITQRKN
ncbi:oxygen binding protein, partial [Reticulomyxa filosa]